MIPGISGVFAEYQRIFGRYHANTQNIPSFAYQKQTARKNLSGLWRKRILPGKVSVVACLESGIYGPQASVVHCI